MARIELAPPGWKPGTHTGTPRPRKLAATRIDGEPCEGMPSPSWTCRPVLPRLIAVLQTAAFLFRHGTALATPPGIEPESPGSEPGVRSAGPRRWRSAHCSRRRTGGHPGSSQGQAFAGTCAIGQGGWIPTTDLLLPRQAGTGKLPYTLMKWPSRQESNLHTASFVARCSSG